MWNVFDNTFNFKETETIYIYYYIVANLNDLALI